MSYFMTRFKEHPVHETLAKLEHSVADCGFVPGKKGVAPEYARVPRVLQYVRHALNQADPEFVTPSMLTELKDHLHTMQDRHDVFKSDLRIEPLTNGSDGVLNALRLLTPMKQSAQEYSESLGSFRDRAATELATVAEKAETFESAVDSLNRDLAKYKDQFEQQKQRVDELIAQQQRTFHEGERDRNDRVIKIREHWQDEFRELAATTDERVKERLSAIDDAGKEHLEEAKRAQVDYLAQMKKHVDKAAEMEGIITNTGMTGHYENVAETERKSANRMRALALFFFVLMLGGVVWLIFEIKSEDFAWGAAVLRFGVSGVAAIPAFYCARESQLHRKAAERHKRIRLELASLAPYLGEMSENARRRAMEQLAPRYFRGNAGDDGLALAPSDVESDDESS